MCLSSSCEVSVHLLTSPGTSKDEKIVMNMDYEQLWLGNSKTYA